MSHQGQRITHYSYLRVPGSRGRNIVASYNLDAAGEKRRRKIIGRIMDDGYLLAACPWGCKIQSLADLRRTIDWLYNER